MPQLTHWPAGRVRQLTEHLVRDHGASVDGRNRATVAELLDLHNASHAMQPDLGVAHDWVHAEMVDGLTDAEAVQ